MIAGPRAAAVAAIVATVAEAASNALFAYELGGLARVPLWGASIALDGLLLAAASAAVAVIQAQTATALLTPGQQSRAWLALALAGCMAYSAGAMASHLLKLQRYQLDAEASAGTPYARAAVERDATRRLAAALETELAATGAPRPAATVQAAIDAAPVPVAVLARSRGCTDISQTNTQQACAPLLALREELTRAERADVIRARLVPARERAATAEIAFASLTPPTPRGEAERLIANWLPWLFAAVLELCATFGFAVARLVRPTPPAEVEPPAKPARQPRKPRTEAPADASGDDAILAALADVARGGSRPGAKLDGGAVRFALRSAPDVFGVPSRVASASLQRLAAAGRIALASGPKGTEARLLS